MAQHGYLHDIDDGWGRNDAERDRDDRDRERGWSQRDHERDKDRGFMFGDRDRDFGGGDDRRPEGNRWSSRDWRGSSEDEWRTGDTGMGGYGRERGGGGFERDHDRGRQQGRADWERAPRNYSSHQDDHYRSWRDRQMASLDRDYADYCREREQQFHRDFDTWRSNRPSRGSSGQQQPSAEQQQTMELDNPVNDRTGTQGSPDPTATATLGTNTETNSNAGRARRDTV